ncbi:MAG: thioredoxin family protein [Planctomycetota bacterium]|nr:thioredoxin family protein [Planctomycetota bacterium]
MDRFRQLAILLMGLCVFASAWADAPTVDESVPTIQWRDDLKKATEEVSQQQRPLLLVFTMERCSYCTLMKRTTYHDEQVVASINENFVPIQICGPDHQRLAQRLGVRVYPTTIIISPENRVVDRMDGYVKAQAILPRLASATHRIEQARVDSVPVR